MKRTFILVLIGCACFLSSYAQKIKTDVLVVGNGNAAVAAGLQSAISGVNTMLIFQEPNIVLSPPDNSLRSGLESSFLKRYRKAKNITDSLATITYDDQTIAAVVKQWADSTKKLTIKSAIKWTKFKRSGSGWTVELQDGTTIRAKVLVNAEISKTASNQWQPLDYSNEIYRTSIGAGYPLQNSTASIISLYNLLQPDQENLVSLTAGKGTDTGLQSMAAGQAAGATAAYAAFFNTKTSLSNLKAIQGELINYRLALMPFVDVPEADTNFKSIQFVGVTGVLKAEIKNGEAYFLPERPVTTEEVKAPFKNLYYKAQIWFDDYKSDQMTVEATISLACTTGSKAIKNTIEEVRKKWKTTYGFKTEFDLNKVATRREFAVIMQDYSPPNNVFVDKTGRVVK